MSGNGGGDIIISNARKTAELETVTANLTPSECDSRDEILAKPDRDWKRKDLVKIFALIAKAAGRCW